MKKIYISGPISGTDDYMERFGSAERFLRSKGYDVVNPAAENAKLPEGTSWKGYMAECLRLLLFCDGICMLKGWSGSRGAKLELEVARRCDLVEIYEVEME